MFAITFPWERYSKRRFVELAVKCPSCQSVLVFLHDEKNIDSGRCYNCGQQIFELGAEQEAGVVREPRDGSRVPQP